MDRRLRELERKAIQTGTRDDAYAYAQALIRANHDPVPLYKQLADTFGYPEDIDSYIDAVARDPDALEDFLESFHSYNTIPGGVVGHHEEIDYEPSWFFAYEAVKTWINAELDGQRRRLRYGYYSTRDWYNYDVLKVVRVYSNYHVQDFDEQLNQLEGWQTGVIADVIVKEKEYFKLASGATPLREDPYETTIIAEDWFAIPDAPDATPYGSTIIRWNKPARLWGRALSIINTIKEVGPEFARASLIPRLERLHDLGWKGIQDLGDEAAVRYMNHRQNPDESTRSLENKYKGGGGAEELVRWVSALRRAGDNEKADDAEYEYLWPFLVPFYEAFIPYDHNAWSLRDDPESLSEFKDPLDKAKNILTQKAREIGVSPSRHCYRPYHHIPYINSHLRELAYLHNSVQYYAGRDDDSYTGTADFTNPDDAEEFKEAIKSQFIDIEAYILDRKTLEDAGWRLHDDMKLRVKWGMWK